MDGHLGEAGPRAGNAKQACHHANALMKVNESNFFFVLNCLLWQTSDYLFLTI